MLGSVDHPLLAQRLSNMIEVGDLEGRESEFTIGQDGAISELHIGQRATTTNEAGIDADHSNATMLVHWHPILKIGTTHLPSHQDIDTARKLGIRYMAIIFGSPEIGFYMVVIDTVGITKDNYSEVMSMDNNEYVGLYQTGSQFYRINGNVLEPMSPESMMADVVAPNLLPGKIDRHVVASELRIKKNAIAKVKEKFKAATLEDLQRELENRSSRLSELESLPITQTGDKARVAQNNRQHKIMILGAEISALKELINSVPASEVALLAAAADARAKLATVRAEAIKVGITDLAIHGTKL